MLVSWSVLSCLSYDCGVRVGEELDISMTGDSGHTSSPKKVGGRRRDLCVLKRYL